MPVVPNLRRLARVTTLVAVLVLALPVFAAYTREGWLVLLTLLLPMPVAASTALLLNRVLRRVAVPVRGLRSAPAAHRVSRDARPWWGTVLLGIDALLVVELLGVGYLLEGPGAMFGLLVNAYVVGGVMLGQAVAMLMVAGRLRAWETRHRSQVLASVRLSRGTWARATGR